MALITLDKNAYEHNLNEIAKKAGGFEKVICIFKDNAYGHGVCLLAPLAKRCGIDFVALKNEQEATFLQAFMWQNGGAFKRVLVLSHRPTGAENADFAYALNHKSDIERFKSGSKIHIAIDSGMHRNGVAVGDLAEIFDKAKRRNIYIEGLFTHFANADELDGRYFVQKKCFESAKKRALQLSSQRLIFHSHNSAALFRCGEFPADELCRVGLAQFGYNEFCVDLKRVLRLYAHKLSSRTLFAGQSVGYGGVFTAQSDLNIATYDLGYADGLFRYGGKGILELATPTKDGKMGHLLGRMSMDSFSAQDLGDEVCVFDDARIWAKFFGTIEYEILAKLSPLIPRKLV